jgi:hypothetical protein
VQSYWRFMHWVVETRGRYFVFTTLAFAVATVAIIVTSVDEEGTPAWLLLLMVVFFGLLSGGLSMVLLYERTRRRVHDKSK